MVKCLCKGRCHYEWETLLNFNFKGGVGKTTLTVMETYLLGQEGKKVVKLISTISVGAVLVGSSILVTSQNSEAAYVSREATYTWKSAVNITTGWFTLHGRGYSYPNSGKVSSVWITSGSALFNSIVNKSHWTYKTPRGVHLMGKATDKYVIGTQWAYIPINTDTQTVCVQF